MSSKDQTSEVGSQRSAGTVAALRPSPYARPVSLCAVCGRAIGWVYIQRRDGGKLHVACGSVQMARDLRAAQAAGGRR